MRAGLVDLSIMRRAPAVLAMGATFALAGCSFTLDLDECEKDADCADGLSCRDRLCVHVDVPLDPRCTAVGDTAAADPLRFGAVLPITAADGTPHEWGPFWRASIQLAVDELNLRFGATGRQLSVLVCDTSGNRDAAIELSTDLVGRGVPAILSDGSQETIAASQVTIPAGVLLMSGAATAPEIADLPDEAPGGGVGLVWRTTPSDVLQAQVIAEELAREAPRVAVIARDDAYGQGLSLAFATLYSGDTDSFAFPAGGDVTSALQEAAAYAPQVALVVGFPEDVVSVVNGAAATPGLAGVDWFFTQGAKFPDLFSRLDDPTVIEGARGTSPATAAFGSEAYLWFESQYDVSVGVDPATVVDAANMFDAAMLLAVSAEWAEAAEGAVTGAGMARGLTHVSAGGGALVVPLVPPSFYNAADEVRAGREIDIEGASGHLQFDATTGEAPADIEVWAVEGGTFVTEKVVTP